MLYRYPEVTTARVRVAYRRYYENPIAVRAGERLRRDPVRSAETDIFGWSWCVGPDGREGWFPDAWAVADGEDWVALRDFNAMELSVEPGQRLRLLYAESGFAFARAEDGSEGWVPDGVLALAES